MITEISTKIELESDRFNSKHEYTQKHGIVTRPKYNPQQKRGKLQETQQPKPTKKKKDISTMPRLNFKTYGGGQNQEMIHTKLKLSSKEVMQVRVKVVPGHGRERERERDQRLLGF